MDVTRGHVLTLYKWLGQRTRREGRLRRTTGSHDSPTLCGRCSAMSSSLVVGGIKVSRDRDPKISSARTTLHAAWAMGSRVVSLRKLLPSRELKGEPRLLKDRQNRSETPMSIWTGRNLFTLDVAINILLSLRGRTIVLLCKKHYDK